VDRADLIAQCGEIPSTAEQITGGGGRHVFFHYSGGPVPKTLAPGIELKGDGGYVIVAPSVHRSGNPYRWDGITGPKALLHLAEAPPWLAERISSCSTNVPVERSRPQPGKIREGQRNDTLFRLGCSLRSKGFSEAAIRAALIEENRVRCSPALPDDEVRRIAASASKYELGADTAPDAPRGLGGLDVSAVRTPAEALAVLNTLSLWKGRIRWQAFRRRGSQIEGQTEDGTAVRFAADRILTFAYARAQIYAATDVAILEPKKGRIKSVWSEVCELVSHAARADAVQCGNPEDDLAADLQRAFELSGKCHPKNRTDLRPLILSLKAYRRDPHAEKAPACVFLWQRKAYVYLPVLRVWLGTPAGLARQASLQALREHLGLLGFRQDRVEYDQGGKRLTLDMWSGPQGFLDEEDA
jgi:hypothetical protein